jgi:hypothetical protein
MILWLDRSNGAHCLHNRAATVITTKSIEFFENDFKDKRSAHPSGHLRNWEKAKQLR